MNTESNLILVNFRGMIIPLKEEEVNEFFNSLEEWDN